MRIGKSVGPGDVRGSSAGRDKDDAVSSRVRSAISNGSRLHADVDGRSREARRWRDLFRHFVGETGGKSEQMCRTLASLMITREVLDAKLARGENVDAGELIRLTGAITRTMTKAGLAADVTDSPPPDLTSAAIERMRGSFS